MRVQYHTVRTKHLTRPSIVCDSGTVYCRWNKTAAYLGVDPKKVCGPVAMSLDFASREKNCCMLHPLGYSGHAPLKLDGKPFVVKNRFKELVGLKLLEVRPELKKERDEKKDPPGPPKDVNGVKVYPDRHFA